MSFGIGAGDIIAAVRLSWAVYRACKGSAKEFQEISREVKYNMFSRHFQSSQTNGHLAPYTPC